MSQLDLRRDAEKQLKKIIRKYKRDAKLQELESQLEFAESRCGTLKQQLDYIKLFYKCGRNHDLEKQSSKEGGYGDGSAVQQLRSEEFSQWLNENEKITSKIESTPSSDSFSDPFTVDEISNSNTATTESSNKLICVETHPEKKKTPKPKTNLKISKVKKKCGKKVKKRRKLEEQAKVSNASSQTHNQICPDAVVEIYKNLAANAESESALEVIRKNKFLKPFEVFKPKNHNNNLISGKKSSEGKEEIKAKSFNCLSLEKEPKSGVQEETQTNLPELKDFVPRERTQSAQFLSEETPAPKAEIDCMEAMKNYSKPTISSKRKQVERDICLNLTNLNIRNIPFVAAKSTAPSHNIGVNIQQVLSIIKKRRPLSENMLLNTSRNLENSSTAGKTENKANETVSAPATEISNSWELKKGKERPKTTLSHWRSNAEISKTTATSNRNAEGGGGDWNLKIEKLKTVLVFLHEDFTALSHKYKRLQKKLTKRNITKRDAKDELARIERDLEKKEEEIVLVITLYKEVVSLREELKKLQDKYNFVASGRKLMLDGLRQSTSAHTQMTSLLRKIQNFQSQLKG